MTPGNRIAIVAVGLVALILGYVALKPKDDDTTTSATATQTTAAPATVTAPGTVVTTVRPTTTTTAPPTFTVTVRNGKPVGGVKEISVTKGDRVQIKVTDDAADEVHLHGYDIEEPVAPGQPATFDFTAKLEGIFEMELHSSETQIASLQVNPS